MSSPTIFELSPIMQEVLESGGQVRLKPRGVSMLPFIRPERDEIVLTRAHPPYRRFQIYLYQRPGGNLVLHRLVSCKEGQLVFRGDNQLSKEQGITPENIIGKLESVQRGNRLIKSDSMTFWGYAVCCLPICFSKRAIAKIFRRIKH